MSILPYPPSILPRHLVRRLAAELLPSSCLLCGDDTGGPLLCASCDNDLPILPSERLCPRCALPTTHGEHCGACLKEPPHYNRALALWAYEFPADRIIHALKYQHRLAVADWLGSRLAERLTPAGQTLLPMPLHTERLRERGFNQAGEIARGMARTLGLPYQPDLLHRQRPTRPQAELLPGERQRNVRGAFACSGDLGGRHVVLVDDVMTTGASANECARVLRLHGAGDITLVVAARALKH
ncbi:MAG: phosphoribosyltransferase [Betaproteobacteria bacterium HGW-Betaproteobacteria-7]|jgi:ComF family protein|nr:MAG: phosphoribosyltransferase [Betaproteobacteria bacterium HGW-Betaproteobacteria-7]